MQRAGPARADCKSASVGMTGPLAACLFASGALAAMNAGLGSFFRERSGSTARLTAGLLLVACSAAFCAKHLNQQPSCSAHVPDSERAFHGAIMRFRFGQHFVSGFYLSVSTHVRYCMFMLRSTRGRRIDHRTIRLEHTYDILALRSRRQGPSSTFIVHRFKHLRIMCMRFKRSHNSEDLVKDRSSISSLSRAHLGKQRAPRQWWRDGCICSLPDRCSALACKSRC